MRWGRADLMRELLGKMYAREDLAAAVAVAATTAAAAGGLRMPPQRGRPAAAEAVADRLESALGTTGRWLAGDAFSLGDVAMASFADRVVNLGMEFLWETRPAAGDWARRLLARPGVQAACPPAGERLPAPAADTIVELRRRLG